MAIDGLDSATVDWVAGKSLKPCPCGQTPDKLILDGWIERDKWARVYGDCCAEWMVEARVNCVSTEAEALKAATEAWNNAPRAGGD